MSVLPGEASPGNYFDILIEGEYMDNLGTHAVVNGKLILASEAVLPVQDKAVQSGFGVYESLKIVQSKVVYLEDHLHRLNQSAQGIGLSHPFTNDQISEWIYLLINNDENSVDGNRASDFDDHRPSNVEISRHVV